MKKLKIYCVTNKEVNFINDNNALYNFAWVGKEEKPNNYISCNDLDNIFHKEKYYSELTFHYWYWKNQLSLDRKKFEWIGFCQKRRYWVNNYSSLTITKKKINEHLLGDIPNISGPVNAFVCSEIFVNNIKKIKMLKRAPAQILKNPSIFFSKKKQTIKFHFDMHHGFGNIEKAAQLLDPKDKYEFINYINSRTYFNPNIMFIAKPEILDQWFNDLFKWLFKCEKIFGFNNLTGYDTQRLYAYLAERYMSYWFKKYSIYEALNWSIIEDF